MVGTLPQLFFRLDLDAALMEIFLNIGGKRHKKTLRLRVPGQKSIQRLRTGLLIGIVHVIHLLS